MKLRFLLIPMTAFCMISSCSSCGENTNNGNGTDTNNTVGNNGDDNNGNNIGNNFANRGGDNSGGITPDLPDAEQIQSEINAAIEQEVQTAQKSSSGRVEGIIAGFELGMNSREVKVHMLRLKQKDLLVRVQKSANVFEYVYQLPLKSGKSNTYLDFKYNRAGGLYKALCQPNMLKGVSKSKFIKEVRTLFTEWYGKPRFEIPNHKDCERYVWIDGNRHVDLYCTSKGVEFVYTDLTVELPANIQDGGTDRPDVKVIQ
jgi:hypothetical protein